MIIIVVIIAVVCVLFGRDWRRRGGRWRIIARTVTGVLLLSADLSDAALLLGVLILFVRFLVLVFIFLVVSVVEISATATSQYLAIVVVRRR